MGYSLKFDDITTMEADAVVNSLGIEGKNYGRLCKNIINKANSASIRNTIDSITNGKPGDIVITDGGNLPAKNIIHVVSPFKSEDNDSNDNLYNIYVKVINRAIDEGYKTIVLPLLGSRANGYSANDSYEAVRKAIASFIKLEEKENKEIIDMQVVIFNSSKGKYKKMAERFHRTERIIGNRSSIYEEMMVRGTRNEINGSETFFDESCLEGSESNPLVRKIKEISYLMGLVYDRTDALTPDVWKYNYPFDFVTDWLMRRDLKESVLIGKELLDSHQKINIKKKKHLEKYEIYAIANELEMSIVDIVELMIVNGSSFNPQDDIDCFEVDYLLGKYGVLSKKEYSEASLDITGIYINLGNAEYYKQLLKYKKSH